MNTDLVSYYQQRAEEYEAIYHKPERQQDIAAATAILQTIFLDKEVIEIACGTGFWTERIAVAARSVHATDINQSVIDIGSKKHCAKNNISFETTDLFQYQSALPYQSLFGGFIWSHVLLEELDHFIHTINSLVSNGGNVVLMDNNFVPGSNLPITHTDAADNTFQTRKLADESMHLVLKNFPEEAFLRDKLQSIAGDIHFIRLTYYWMLVYTKA